MYKAYTINLDVSTLSLIKTDNLSELVRRLLKEYADKQKATAVAPNESWEDYAIQERARLKQQEEKELFILKRKNLEDKYEAVRSARNVLIETDPIKAAELKEELMLIKKQIDDLDAQKHP